MIISFYHWRGAAKAKDDTAVVLGCNYALVLSRERRLPRNVEFVGGAMKLLYFPTITIPDEGWLRKALLYSDGIRFIVPSGYLEQHNSHENRRRSMVGIPSIRT